MGLNLRARKLLIIPHSLCVSILSLVTFFFKYISVYRDHVLLRVGLATFSVVSLLGEISLAGGILAVARKEEQHQQKRCRRYDGTTQEATPSFQFVKHEAAAQVGGTRPHLFE